MTSAEKIRRFMEILGREARRPARIEPDLYRYPAIDPREFRKAVEELRGD